VLGFGKNGFVLQAIYKDKLVRAVKMVIASEHVGRDVKIGKECRIVTTSEEQVRREFEMHNQIFKKATRSSGFQVLKTFGKLAVFAPPGYKNRIGVYIMECLPYRTLDEIIESSNKKATSILRMVQAIPRVIENLQRCGFAHGDLHFENIAFDPDDYSRPFVLDFGRTTKLSQFKKVSEKASFACIDYLVPLYSLTTQIPLYNAFVKAVDIADKFEHIPAALRKKVTEIFSPLTLKSSAKRLRMIEQILDYQELNSNRETYFDITCPG
jgi:tRNA A-37 threonylcarbamoyl transferase component Bud32